MIKIFVDSDVILDLYLERQGFYQSSLELFSMLDIKKMKGYTTPLVYSNLFYIISKYKNRSLAIKNLGKLEAILDIIAVNKKSVSLALTSDFKDFEDALQYFSVVEAKLDYIITRNKKDYKPSRIPVLNAQEFIDTIKL